MGISIIFMFYSPKPDLILDANLNAVGVKDKHDTLKIYADKMQKFNRDYWSNWFGQKNSEVLSLKNNVVIINNEDSIMVSANELGGRAVLINKDFLQHQPVILVFCNINRCYVKADENKKFYFHNIESAQ